MQNFFGQSGEMGNIMATVLVYVVFALAIYFFLWRPNQKKRKAEEALRSSIKIGDEVTTIGGIVGKIVSIKEDADIIVIESGTEKLKLKRWAIASSQPQE